MGKKFRTFTILWNLHFFSFFFMINEGLRL